jgi:hypothetical protein
LAAFLVCLAVRPATPASPAVQQIQMKNKFKEKNKLKWQIIIIIIIKQKINEKNSSKVLQIQHSSSLFHKSLEVILQQTNGSFKAYLYVRFQRPISH